MNASREKVKIDFQKNGLYLDNNVYIIGISLTGPILENFLPPFKVCLDVEIFFSNGMYSTANFNKTTDFNKIIEPYGLYNIKKTYSSFYNIYVYYERVSFDIKEKIISKVSINLKCFDSSNNAVFEEHKSFSNIKTRWNDFKAKDELKVYYSSQLEIHLFDSLIDELYSSYLCATKFFATYGKRSIKVYITDNPAHVYDIVTFFPINVTSSIAVGNDRIVIIKDESKNIGISFSPHEFVHLFINDIINHKITGSEKAFIEGICELISEDYRLRIGWLPMENRAAIGLEVINIFLKKDIVTFFRQKIDINKEISFEFYMILPFIVRMVLRLANKNVFDLIRGLCGQETIYDILKTVLDNPEAFLENSESAIKGFSTIKEGIICGYYSKRKQIYYYLKEDICTENLLEIKKDDYMLQKFLVSGDIGRARLLLSKYEKE